MTKSNNFVYNMLRIGLKFTDHETQDKHKNSNVKMTEVYILIYRENKRIPSPKNFHLSFDFYSIDALII